MIDPAEQVDKRKLRAKEYGDDSRLLLEHVWALMGFPCGKYLAVMRELWFARTLTMTDLVTGWTENASIRNNGGF